MQASISDPKSVDKLNGILMSLQFIYKEAVLICKLNFLE